VTIAASIVAFEKCNDGEAQFVDSLAKGQVSERSERAFWKTSILAMKCAK